MYLTERTSSWLKLSNMDLKEYFELFPRGRRGAIRRRFADAHKVSEVTVRSWANGTRKHPCSLETVRITEKFTDYRVTRHQLRPDIFGSNADAAAVREKYSDKSLGGES